jgi:membrane-bound lytic murein transglycosylase F
MNIASTRFIAFSTLFFLLFFSCTPRKEKGEEICVPPYIERGKLVAITDYNSTSYFIYRGEPMGYQYELLNLFAQHLGVRLEILVSNDLRESFEVLLSGECDLLALNLTVTKERSRLVDFTKPFIQTRQVLVQKKPANWQLLSERELEAALIRNQLDLAGKTIHVQKNSAYAARLHNLSEEIGDTINIVEVPYESEQLITMVAEGEIEYTVSDENIARVNQTYYPEIDIITAVSFPQNLAWAVQRGDDQLREEINTWLEGFSGTIESQLLYAKYFRNPRSARFIRSDYFALTSGRISPYDDLIKKYSEEIDWDWRLLASLIYQESRFYPEAESWAGAAGLMQLMPSTAERFGVSQISDPEQNIAAGVKFIKWLDDILSDRLMDESERLKFILASYNVGLGHVLDARALARKNNKDPDVWTGSVDYFLLNKSNPEYYLDPVVRHGYCRGEEPYKYVTEILERYDHYRNIVQK